MAALRGPARGLEWSHWIPKRYSTRGVPGLGGAKLPTWVTEAGWNGKYTSGLEHALNDPYRYRFLPRALKDQHPINPALLRQWNRMPNWAQGGAMGGAYGGASMAAGRSCGC